MFNHQPPPVKCPKCNGQIQYKLGPNYEKELAEVIACHGFSNPEPDADDWVLNWADHVCIAQPNPRRAQPGASVC